MTPLHAVSQEAWATILADTFRLVSRTPACGPILHHIGEIHLQLDIQDRPEMSYWEEYLGHSVVPHLGVTPTPSVIVSTRFETLVDTLLNRISLMEAAADEVYVLSGDTSALMRCANILPYVMAAFSKVAIAMTDPADQEHR